MFSDYSITKKKKKSIVKTWKLQAFGCLKPLQTLHGREKNSQWKLESIMN